MKKNVWKIIEDRGCGITYDIFNSNTKSDCIAWINLHTKPHPLNESIRISNEEYTNGNGDFFTYSIEEK